MQLWVRTHWQSTSTTCNSETRSTWRLDVLVSYYFQSLNIITVIVYLSSYSSFVFYRMKLDKKGDHISTCRQTDTPLWHLIYLSRWMRSQKKQKTILLWFCWSHCEKLYNIGTVRIMILKISLLRSSLLNMRN